MKFLILLIILAEFMNTTNAQNISQVDIAQGQLDAYNNQNIEDFLKWYADDVEVYNFPNELVYTGLDEMRKRYTKAWKLNPNQKAEVTNRMSLENTVMDQEKVTGRKNDIELSVIAIYKIKNSKIQKVYFVRN